MGAEWKKERAWMLWKHCLAAAIGVFQLQIQNTAPYGAIVKKLNFIQTSLLHLGAITPSGLLQEVPDMA